MSRHFFTSALCIFALIDVALAEEDSDDAPDEVEQVQKAFHASAVRIYKSLAGEMSEEEKRAAKEQFDAEEEELPEKLADVAVVHFREALAVSREEAKALLAGKFDDRGNRAKIKEAKALMARLEIPLPRIHVVLIQNVDSGQIKTGFDLEFAARFLHHHVLVAKKVLESRRPPPRDRGKAPGKPQDASEKPSAPQDSTEK